ncbi:Uncharacterised protein [Mycobacteroides abscessus subsp. massiliense]|nr:Uncharacterised protein [Mycobacteroides abscessus subsp. massiliense]
MQTEPRFTKTNTIDTGTNQPPVSISVPRKLPPSVAGERAAPRATITPPTTMAAQFPIGKAAKEAQKPCRPLRDHRVKSAVMVPESMKQATTNVTAAPMLMAATPAPPRYSTASEIVESRRARTIAVMPSSR